jgi:hypothetical protein
VISPFLSAVILNSFQDPSRPTALPEQVEKWTLKQVQGDEKGAVL